MQSQTTQRTPQQLLSSAPQGPWEVLQDAPGTPGELGVWVRAGLVSAALVDLLVPYLLEASSWDATHWGPRWLECIQNAGWASTLAVACTVRALLWPS